MTKEQLAAVKVVGQFSRVEDENDVEWLVLVFLDYFDELEQPVEDQADFKVACFREAFGEEK